MSSSKLSSTSWVCSLPSLSNQCLESLLIPSVAWVTDHDLQYQQDDGGSTVLSCTHHHQWSNVQRPSTVMARGWVGAVRVLAKQASATTSDCLSWTAIHDAWIEAAHSTLWPIWKHSLQQQTSATATSGRYLHQECSTRQKREKQRG